MTLALFLAWGSALTLASCLKSGSALVLALDFFGSALTFGSAFALGAAFAFDSVDLDGVEDIAAVSAFGFALDVAGLAGVSEVSRADFFVVLVFWSQDGFCGLAFAVLPPFVDFELPWFIDVLLAACLFFDDCCSSCSILIEMPPTFMEIFVRLLLSFSTSSFLRFFVAFVTAPLSSLPALDLLAAFAFRTAEA